MEHFTNNDIVDLGNGYGYFCDVENQTQTFSPLHIERHKYIKKTLYRQTLAKNQHNKPIENENDEDIYTNKYAVYACSFITVAVVFAILQT